MQETYLTITIITENIEYIVKNNYTCRATVISFNINKNSNYYVFWIGQLFYCIYLDDIYEFVIAGKNYYNWKKFDMMMLPIFWSPNEKKFMSPFYHIGK